MKAKSAVMQPRYRMRVERDRTKYRRNEKHEPSLMKSVQKMRAEFPLSADDLKLLDELRSDE